MSDSVGIENGPESDNKLHSETHVEQPTESNVDQLGEVASNEKVNNTDELVKNEEAHRELADGDVENSKVNEAEKKEERDGNNETLAEAKVEETPINEPISDKGNVDVNNQDNHATGSIASETNGDITEEKVKETEDTIKPEQNDNHTEIEAKDQTNENKPEEKTEADKPDDRTVIEKEDERQPHEQQLNLEDNPGTERESEKIIDGSEVQAFIDTDREITTPNPVATENVTSSAGASNPKSDSKKKVAKKDPKEVKTIKLNDNKNASLKHISGAKLDVSIKASKDTAVDSNAPKTARGSVPTKMRDLIKSKSEKKFTEIGGGRNKHKNVLLNNLTEHDIDPNDPKSSSRDKSFDGRLGMARRKNRGEVDRSGISVDGHSNSQNTSLDTGRKMHSIEDCANLQNIVKQSVDGIFDMLKKNPDMSKEKRKLNSAHVNKEGHGQKNGNIDVIEEEDEAQVPFKGLKGKKIKADLIITPVKKNVKRSNLLYKKPENEELEGTLKSNKVHNTDSNAQPGAKKDPTRKPKLNKAQNDELLSDINQAVQGVGKLVDNLNIKGVTPNKLDGKAVLKTEGDQVTHKDNQEKKNSKKTHKDVTQRDKNSLKESKDPKELKEIKEGKTHASAQGKSKPQNKLDTSKLDKHNAAQPKNNLGVSHKKKNSIVINDVGENTDTLEESIKKEPGSNSKQAGIKSTPKNTDSSKKGGVKAEKEGKFNSDKNTLIKQNLAMKFKKKVSGIKSTTDLEDIEVLEKLEKEGKCLNVLNNQTSHINVKEILEILFLYVERGIHSDSTDAARKEKDVSISGILRNAIDQLALLEDKDEETHSDPVVAMTEATESNVNTVVNNQEEVQEDNDKHTPSMTVATDETATVVTTTEINDETKVVCETQEAEEVKEAKESNDQKETVVEAKEPKYKITIQNKCRVNFNKAIDDASIIRIQRSWRKHYIYSHLKVIEARSVEAFSKDKDKAEGLESDVEVEEKVKKIIAEDIVPKPTNRALYSKILKSFFNLSHISKALSFIQDANSKWKNIFNYHYLEKEKAFLFDLIRNKSDLAEEKPEVNQTKLQEIYSKFITIDLKCKSLETEVENDRTLNNKPHNNVKIQRHQSGKIHQKKMINQKAPDNNKKNLVITTERK